MSFFLICKQSLVFAIYMRTTVVLCVEFNPPIVISSSVVFYSPPPDFDGRPHPAHCRIYRLNPHLFRTAMTSSDESLKIWNFWPSSAGRNRRGCTRRAPKTATFPNDPSTVRTVVAAPPPERRALHNPPGYGHETNNHHNWYRSNYQSAAAVVSSQLSLDASRVIK